MTKSIRYKITQIKTVTVLDVISICNPWQLEPSHKMPSFIMQDGDVISFESATKDEALDWINQIHAAIHKEFAGEWEPEEGEEVSAINLQGCYEAAYYVKKHANGHIVSAKGNATFIRYVERVQRVTGGEIPTGPCEVCYGIEGCEDGVQPDKAATNMFTKKQILDFANYCMKCHTDTISEFWKSDQDEVQLKSLSELFSEWIGGGE